MSADKLLSVLHAHLRCMATDNVDNRETAADTGGDYAVGVCDGTNKAIEEISRLLKTLVAFEATTPAV